MGAGPSALGGSYSFGGKHVFLTGGANGIGFAMAELLLKRGAKVTFTDISDAAKALSALQKIAGDASHVKFIKADVTVYQQMTDAVKEAERDMGPLDVVIPNAGIASGGLFIDERVEDLEKVNKVNLMGVIYTLKAALPGMLERKQGRVLMMASLMAMFAGFCSSAYVAPKAAVLSLANALRLELLGTGVDITIAMPAFTDTAMRSVGLDNPRSPDFAKQLTKEMKVYTPGEVAEFAIQGVERGYFFARSPDFMSNLAISSCSGVAPKLFNSFLEFLLLPIYYLIHVTVRRSIDKRILRWRKEEPAELKIKSQSTSAAGPANGGKVDSTDKTDKAKGGSKTSAIQLTADSSSTRKRPSGNKEKH